MSQGRQYGSAFTPIKGAGTNLVVGGGVAIATQSYHTLDDSIAPVDLNTLNGMEIGDEVTLVLANGGNGAIITTIGNLDLPLGQYVRLDVVTDYVVLKRSSSTRWALTSQSVAQLNIIGVVLAGDAFTVTDRIHQVGGETGNPDDLWTINGGSVGQKLRIVRGGQDITVVDAGNIKIPLGGAFVLRAAGDSFDVEFDSISGWQVVATNLASDGPSRNVDVSAGTMPQIEQSSYQLNGGGGTAILNNIVAAADGKRVRFYGIGAPDVIVVATSANITTPLGVWFVMDVVGDYFEAIYDATNAVWNVVSTCLANEGAGPATDVSGGSLAATLPVLLLEGGGATAILSNITNGAGGQRLKIISAGDPDVIVLQGGGNIVIPLNFDVVLYTAGDYAELVYDAVNAVWVLVSLCTAIETAETAPIDVLGAMRANYHTIAVAPNGGPGPDNLDNITSSVSGKVIRVTASDSAASPITLRHNQGGGVDRILCPNGMDLSLRTPTDWVELFCDGDDWLVTGYNLTWSGADTGSPPSNVYIQYQRITVGSLPTATLSADINLGASLPVGCEVLDVVMDTKVTWADTGATPVATLNVQVGTTGAAAGIRAQTDVFGAAPGRGLRAAKGAGVGGLQIVANFVAVGNNLDHLTAGSADFYVMYMMLPVVGP